jgi:sporulation protein YlmC with PRC-barrel domain
MLDKPVVDKDGREMGRVDGVVLEQDPGKPPRLATILIGPSVLGERLHPRLGRWIRTLERRWGVDANRPTRIDMSDVTEITWKVSLRLSIEQTEVDAWEKKIRRWLVKLPGGR